MPDTQELDELDSEYDDAEEYGDEREGFKIRLAALFDETWDVFVQRCISDPLPLPSASVYSTMQLHAMIHEGHIDLNPPYQRGPLP